MFGATRLQKMLFLADFLSYRRTGESITGQEYQRLPRGPAARRYKPVEADLLSSDSAVIQERPLGAGIQKRLVALRKPDLSGFTAEEISIADEAVSFLSGMSADEVSRWSHGFVGWRLARTGETIPYETILIAPPEPLSESTEEWVSEIAACGRAA
jgi:hypothetical protein